MTPKVGYISHPDFLRHEMGDRHPESPERLLAIEASLKRAGLWQRLHHELPKPVKEQVLRLVHSAEHLEFIDKHSPQTGYFQIDEDTFMNPSTLHAAKLSAGSLVLAVDRVLSGTWKRAFCAVRPPGHHAEAKSAMGFCFYNNVAVGAAHALKEYPIERVAIFDFDVHFGNGTEDIFKDNPKVMIGSSFQHPLYPIKDFVTHHPRIANLTLTAGDGSEAFRSGIMRRWEPLVKEFKPQLLFVSAGFDAHAMDPLGELNLTTEDYSWVTEKIVEWANLYAEGRIISTLEGGYHIDSLSESCATHISVLLKD